MKRRIVFLFCIICCLAVLCTVASAEDYTVLPQNKLKERPELSEVRVYFKDKLCGRAYEREGKVFISLSEFAGLYGVNINLTADEEGFAAIAEGLDINAEVDTNYLTANYRYIFLPSGYIICGDDIYLPTEALARIFGVKINASPERVDLNTKQCRLISGTQEYYKLNMPPDYQYWMPRIIKTETFEEPMAGKIAVGNVIENRVKSPRFPDDIYKVIYDNNTGVQFTPATSGALTSEPDEISWIAACLCYEGYNTAEDSLHFANPENNGTYWLENNCIFVKSIGRHDFFK